MVPSVSEGIILLEECHHNCHYSLVTSKNKSAVLNRRGDLCDFDFNPFNDEQIVSSSADLTIMVILRCHFSFVVVGIP